MHDRSIGLQAHTTVVRGVNIMASKKKKKADVINFNIRLVYDPSKKTYSLGFIDRLYEYKGKTLAGEWKNAGKRDRGRIEKLIGSQ